MSPFLYYPKLQRATSDLYKTIGTEESYFPDKINSSPKKTLSALQRMANRISGVMSKVEPLSGRLATLGYPNSQFSTHRTES